MIWCCPSVGLAVLQRILDTAAEHTWQVTSINLETLTETAFVNLLADIDKKKEFQLIIDCELEKMNYILNLVNTRLLLSHLLWQFSETAEYQRHHRSPSCRNSCSKSRKSLEETEVGGNVYCVGSQKLLSVVLARNQPWFWEALLKSSGRRGSGIRQGFSL